MRTKILLIALLFVSLLIVNVSANSSEKNDNCTKYFYFDNSHKLCNEKRFCGSFMYEGLRVFDNIKDCNEGLARVYQNITEFKNYGQCVKNAGAQEIICFKQSHIEYASCKKAITESIRSTNKSELNKTEIRLKQKKCQSEYLADKNICKEQFRYLKANCTTFKCKSDEVFSDGKCLKMNKKCNQNSSEYSYLDVPVENCSDTQILCSSGYKPFYDECGCGCKFNEEKHFCKQKDREADVCLTVIDPVCGWFNSTIQCFRYPCAQEFNNSCEACRDSSISFYTKGACPDPVV